MFKDVKEISRYFAVKFEDGTYLCQGNKTMKLFRKCQRAEKALENSLEDGFVVEVTVGEVAASGTLRVDTSCLQNALTQLAASLGTAHKVDLYKYSVVSNGGYNVIRFSPIGSPATRQPGDSYTDIELHLQIRLNH